MRKIKEGLFYIDGEGILPKKAHNMEDYITYGEELLEISADPEFKEQLINFLKYEEGNIIKPHKIKRPLVQEFKKRFNCNVSWINSFKVYDLLLGQGGMYKYTYKRQKIPTVLKSAFLTGDIRLTHELIHAVRINVGGEEAFEEAYAAKFYLLKWHYEFSPIGIYQAWFKIKKAEKKLEDLIGDKKEYVSIRLKEKELIHIADTPNIDIKNYLKSQKTLRHRIITERLGI